MLTPQAKAAALAGITGVPRDDQPKIIALLLAAGTDDVEVWTGAALCPEAPRNVSPLDRFDLGMRDPQVLSATYADRARLDLVRSADDAGRQVLGPIVVTELRPNAAGSRVWQARALTVPVDVVRLDLVTAP